MSKSGEKSALKEWVESVSVFIQLSSFYLAPVLSPLITIYFLFYSCLWPLMVAYLIWIYIDRDTPFTKGRSLKFTRNLCLWKHFQDYFPQKLIKTAELNASRNHLFCCFPHGILATAPITHFSTDISPMRKFFPWSDYFILTLNFNFHIPFFRETLLGYGSKSVSKRSMLSQLTGTQGKIVAMCPGGSAEAAKSSPGTYRIAIKSRKGFVKIAIITGTNLVPVISFGETDLYEHKTAAKGSFLESALLTIRKKTGVALCFISGRGFLRLFPKRIPVTTIIGKPIIIKKNENPTDEEVDSIHAEFLENLNELFEEHKGQYVKNPESTFLSIED